eukprot:EG_transcript_17218
MAPFAALAGDVVMGIAAFGDEAGWWGLRHSCRGCRARLDGDDGWRLLLAHALRGWRQHPERPYLLSLARQAEEAEEEQDGQGREDVASSSQPPRLHELETEAVAEVEACLTRHRGHLRALCRAVLSLRRCDPADLIRGLVTWFAWKMMARALPAAPSLELRHTGSHQGNQYLEAFPASAAEEELCTLSLGCLEHLPAVPGGPLWRGLLRGPDWAASLVARLLPAPTTVPRASVWECDTDHGWHPYPPDTAAALDKARRRKEPSVMFHRGWVLYTVRLPEMVQVNERTKKRRAVRRRRAGRPVGSVAYAAAAATVLGLLAEHVRFRAVALAHSEGDEYARDLAIDPIVTRFPALAARLRPQYTQQARYEWRQ